MFNAKKNYLVMMCFLSFLVFWSNVLWFGLSVCLRERNTWYSIDDSLQQNTKLRMVHSLNLSLWKRLVVHRTTSTEKGTDDASCRLSRFVSIACVVLPYWGTERVFHVARLCPTCAHAFEINEKLIPSIRFEETLWMDPPKKSQILKPNTHQPTYLSISGLESWHRLTPKQ